MFSRYLLNAPGKQALFENGMARPTRNLAATGAPRTIGSGQRDLRAIFFVKSRALRKIFTVSGYCPVPQLCGPGVRSSHDLKSVVRKNAPQSVVRVRWNGMGLDERLAVVPLWGETLALC